MSALAPRPRLLEPDGARSEVEELRREIDRLRAFVEVRAQAQENLVRAMLGECTARAAEALEGRIQIAAREAMAFAESGLERHEATLRSVGRRLAEISRQAAAPELALGAPAATGAYWIGGGDASGYRRLEIRDDSDESFLADLANLPILPGGAARLVAAHVVQYIPGDRLAQILPHWRSRLAPGGELAIVTLDGPAWAADLSCGDYQHVRRRLRAEGKPPRNLFDAGELAEMLMAAGLRPDAPAMAAPHELTIVAKAPVA